jgi:glycosyltransferase involved in cell wall biosynthesis
LREDVAVQGNAPLAGKTVAVVHVAWHSCGSHQLFVGEIKAYKALGARVISVAVMDVPSRQAPNGGRWPSYIAATQDIVADKRYFAAAPVKSLWRSGLLNHGWWPLIHGDQATWLVELVKRAPLPEGLAAERVDLVHANHFFTMPLARRLRGPHGAPPIVLGTQDIQARQFVLRNQSGFFVPPRATYDDMLAIELYWTGRADLCEHLNADEHQEFRKLLPRRRHALIYPAIDRVALSQTPREISIVASDNYANFVSLRWFLTEVLPRAGGVPVAIYGNVDKGVKTHDRDLYEAHKGLFKGRVPDVGAIYANAAAILLPTVEGHGISIKSIEALCCGAPLIATPQAFRGMGVDPAKLGNVALCGDADSFAAALRDCHARLADGDAQPASADCATRRVYEENFSPEAYARALAREVLPLLQA